MSELNYWWKHNGSKFTLWHWLYMFTFGLFIYLPALGIFKVFEFVMDWVEIFHETMVNKLPKLKK